MLEYYFRYNLLDIVMVLYQDKTATSEPYTIHKPVNMIVGGE